MTQQTVLIYNGDYNKQKPVTVKQLWNMPVGEMWNVFYDQHANYRRNTGTFLFTDTLAKHIKATWIKTTEFERLRELQPKSLVTTGMHSLSNPQVTNDKLANWHKLLDLNTKIVHMSFGFSSDFDSITTLNSDLLHVLSRMAERNEIGVREVYSAELLNRNGIKNVRVIGCPSLFYPMDRNFKLEQPDGKLRNINGSIAVEAIKDFEHPFGLFHKYLLDLHEGGFRVDLTMQLHLLDAIADGGSFNSNIQYANFVRWPLYNLIMERGRYFFSTEDWIKALKNNDFSIGIKFHGNVAAILAGIPTLFLVPDKRAQGMCELMSLPHIHTTEFDPRKPLEHYYSLVDYSEFNRRYRGNLDNFITYCENSEVELKAKPE